MGQPPCNGGLKLIFALDAFGMQAGRTRHSGANEQQKGTFWACAIRL